MTVRREKSRNAKASLRRSLQSLDTGFPGSQEDVGIRGKSDSGCSDTELTPTRSFQHSPGSWQWGDGAQGSVAVGHLWIKCDTERKGAPPSRGVLQLGGP